MPLMFWRSKSYEVLPALSVRRRELRQSLRTVTIAWMFGIVWMSCAWGAHVKSFARMLGFGDMAFGIMSALPWAAAVGQIVATIIIERTGLRKFQFLYVMTINRALWLLLPLIPLLLPVPSRIAVVTTLVIIGVSRFLGALGMPAWWSWMGDLIPRRIRGRYMAQRDRLAKAVQIFAVIVLGVILDHVTVEGEPETMTAQPMLMVAACAILVVGAIFGIIDILLFARVREIVPTVKDGLHRPAVNIRVALPQNNRLTEYLAYGARYVAAAFKQILGDPLKDVTFRRFVSYGSVLTFAMTVGGWYWWLLAMEHLGFSKLAVNVLFMVVGPISGILSAKPWGRLVDRWGRRPVMVVASAGLILSVFFWFVATPDTQCPGFILRVVNWVSARTEAMFGWQAVPPGAPVGAFMLILLNCALGGAFWSGAFLAMNAIQLGFADGQGRSKYVAASGVLMSAGGVVGGLVGGVITWKLGQMISGPIGPFQWVNWHAAIVLSLVARIASVFIAIRMPDPGSGSIRQMFRLFGINTYNALSPWLFYPLRLIRWRKRDNNRRG